MFVTLHLSFSLPPSKNQFLKSKKKRGGDVLTREIDILKPAVFSLSGSVVTNQWSTDQGLPGWRPMF